MSVFNLLNISASAMTAQSQRMNVSASNLANADSVVGEDGEAYRAKQVRFEAQMTENGQVGGVKVAEVLEDQSPMRREYDPSNPLADEQGYVEKPNVDVVAETVNMISASRNYQANVEVMKTSKELIMSALKIGEN